MTVPLRVAVAASGGLDSTALLHCTARWAGRHGIEVHALHVHHGLLPEADGCLLQLRRQCQRWRHGGQRIAFQAHRVLTRPPPGDSVEAWARRVRYAALTAMAHEAGCSLVLLAHHRRDQAETVLLQALRGAGPAGLSAMPRQAHRAGLTWARPWLNQPREAIEAYARRWQLQFVHDPSNADERHARSRLRQTVWPPLLAAFGDAETALCAAARRAQEARAIVDEVAASDADLVLIDAALDRSAWTLLSEPRRGNVLRHWLARTLPVPPPETLVQRLLHELPLARSGRWPAGTMELRLHAGRLLPHRLQPASQSPAPAPQMLDLSRPGRYDAAPWAGVIRVQPTADGGVPARLLVRCELRARCGGEQFQSHAHGVPRSLKKQFQDRGVPAWARDHPLLFAHDPPRQLLFVPGLGLDARALQAEGSPRLLLDWQD